MPNAFRTSASSMGDKTSSRESRSSTGEYRWIVSESCELRLLGDEQMLRFSPSKQLQPSAALSEAADERRLR